MNEKSPFQIKAVSRYRRALYASESGETVIGRACWLSWFVPKKVAKAAVTLLLAAGLALGVGCKDEGVTKYNPPVVQQEQGEEESSQSQPFVTPPCESGEQACLSEEEFKACDEDGAWQAKDCDEFCEEELGYGYISDGCNEETAENICQCRYDMIEGDWACMDGEEYCSSEETLQICEDGAFEPVDCQDYCVETFGNDYYSKGCETEGACECDYGVVLGGLAECLPEDIQCASAYEVGICSEIGMFEYFDCHGICEDQFGYDYYPMGCNESVSDTRCQCECVILGG